MTAQLQFIIIIIIIIIIYLFIYLHRHNISQNKNDYFPTQSYLAFVMESECVNFEEGTEFTSNLLCGYV